jgi:transcriptional regulator of acetoin/glycerol metabolism
MDIKGHILLCWHAERAGVEVLEHTLKRLKNRGPVEKVLYLVQADSKTGKSITEQVEGAEVERVIVDLKDPTDHQAIYEFVRDTVVPMVSACHDRLHINISPGTPAMHSVWLMLSAGGAFPSGTQFWSSQFNPKTKMKSLKPVDFKITTYLAEIRSARTINPDLALYEPEARSVARKKSLQGLKQYAGLSGHPLLILGERGTGKTRIVETYVSKIKGREVVALACGGLDSSVAESLLFGHVRGAFTGADRDRQGLLGEADGKILFLDEVQDLPKNVQRELVRTLQDHKHRYRQLGNNEEKTSDFELVCASNQSFDELRSQLYPDFLDRIAHLIVEIPPLRSCRVDLPADWQAAWSECRRSHDISEEAPFTGRLQQLLETHQFCGNLRDLQRLAVLTMVWLDKLSEEEAIEMAIKELDKWSLSNSEDLLFGQGTWDERTKWFQGRLASWAVSEYGGLKQAATKLDCSDRTLRNRIS